MESPVFYYEKISARYGCFIMQKQWYDRIHWFWLACCIQVRQNSINHTNVNSHFKHTLFLKWKVRFFIMNKYRRVTDVLLCKNNGMIASVAFDLHAVLKCEKFQQIVQMYTNSLNIYCFWHGKSDFLLCKNIGALRMFYYANKSNGMIAFIAFDLHVVFKCEKTQ